MSTLLEKAKAHPVHNRKRQRSTKEDIDLALAWARDEITLSQVAAAYGLSSGHATHAYSYLARAFRTYLSEEAQDAEKAEG